MTLSRSGGAAYADELALADEPPADEPSADEPLAQESPIPVPLYLSQSIVADEVPVVRPLTPFENCIEVGFPVEQIQTAAGLVADKNLRHNDHTMGAAILTHTQVYSFAYQHCFSDLAKFALQRLAQVLYVARCEYSTLSPYLKDAIRHIYDTTPGPELETDPARKLLSQYFVLQYEKLPGDDLCALAEEGGELMADISRKLIRLLATKSSLICSLETKMSSLSVEVGELQMICKDKEKEIQQIRQKHETGACDRRSSSNLAKKKFGTI